MCRQHKVITSLVPTLHVRNPSHVLGHRSPQFACVYSENVALGLAPNGCPPWSKLPGSRHCLLERPRHTFGAFVASSSAACDTITSCRYTWKFSPELRVAHVRFPRMAWSRHCRGMIACQVSPPSCLLSTTLPHDESSLMFMRCF